MIAAIYDKPTQPCWPDLIPFEFCVFEDFDYWWVWMALICSFKTSTVNYGFSIKFQLKTIQYFIKLSIVNNFNSYLGYN